MNFLTLTQASGGKFWICWWGKTARCSCSKGESIEAHGPGQAFSFSVMGVLFRMLPTAYPYIYSKKFHKLILKPEPMNLFQGFPSWHHHIHVVCWCTLSMVLTSKFWVVSPGLLSAQICQKCLFCKWDAVNVWKEIFQHSKANDAAHSLKGFGHCLAITYWWFSRLSDCRADSPHEVRRISFLFSANSKGFALGHVGPQHT